jgi:hypothetical protein
MHASIINAITVPEARPLVVEALAPFNRLKSKIIRTEGGGINSQRIKNRK